MTKDTRLGLQMILGRDIHIAHPQKISAHSLSLSLSPTHT